jgi:hypothetical protein
MVSMGELLELITGILNASNDYTSSRRKRVISRGFVIFLMLVAIVEIAVLSAWARHQ